MKADPLATLVMLAPLVVLVGCQSEPGRFPLEPAHASASMQFTPERTPWSVPVRLGPGISSPTSNDQNPTISSDGLSLYFCSDRPGGVGGNDLWVSRRQSEDDEFVTATNLGPIVNSIGGDCGTAISVDGLVMFFTSTRSGGAGGQDIYVTVRSNASDDLSWTPPVRLGPAINTSMNDHAPHMTRYRGDCAGEVAEGDDESEPCAADLYFDRGSTTVPTDIHVVKVDPQGYALTDPVVVDGVNSPDADGRVSVRFDLREIVFHSTRGGRGITNVDLFWSARRSPNAPWNTPAAIDELNSMEREFGPSLSRDGRTIYFTRGTGFTINDIWMARR